MKKMFYFNVNYICTSIYFLLVHICAFCFKVLALRNWLDRYKKFRIYKSSRKAVSQ